MTVSLGALQTRALLLDIEGTTTPIEFVYEVLFPYARSHAAEYLARHQDSADCRNAVALLRTETDVAQDSSPAQMVFSLMDRDRKSPGLKLLQGLIWEDGYKSGELRGQVYPDVAPALERWRARSLGIYIYSSGSVLAQQLLFGSTAGGDLTEFLGGYFDTGVGPKTSPDSYRVISERIQVAPSKTLFVSDVVQELDAALSAGLRTALCVRGRADLIGSAPHPQAVGTHPVIRSFDEILD